MKYKVGDVLEIKTKREMLDIMPSTSQGNPFDGSIKWIGNKEREAVVTGRKYTVTGIKDGHYVGSMTTDDWYVTELMVKGLIKSTKKENKIMSLLNSILDPKTKLLRDAGIIDSNENLNLNDSRVQLALFNLVKEDVITALKAEAAKAKA